MILKYYFAINHHTYFEGLTYKRKTACMKRSHEKVEIEIKFIMDRLTNLYNSMMGYEVPLKYLVLGVSAYIVAETQSQSKQSVTISELIEESPKINKRREQLEFGISRNVEAWGRRRTRSTTLISRKGSSLTHSEDWKLSGFQKNEEIQKLDFNIRNNILITNLSKIMSDPQFLIRCWVKIRSNKESLTPALDKKTLDGIDLSWFNETCKQFINGTYQFKPSRKTYISKPSGKLRLLTVPSIKDKIVQEGMRFLLERIYEPTFGDCSHGWRPNRGCDTALKQVKKNFRSISWFIEGDIEQQFPNLNHNIVEELLRKRIKDQAFIDLVYKYLKFGYGETKNDIIPMKIGVVQENILSPLLTNIYMTSFDDWMENILIPEFNLSLRKKTNSVYTKMIRKSKALDKTIRSTLRNDNLFKRLHYVRYANDFLLGVIGSYEDGVKIKMKIKEFLEKELKLNLNLDKTKIIHATKDAAIFLGYRIHQTQLKKMLIRYNPVGKLTRRVTKLNLDAPVDIIVEKLEQNGFARKDGSPTRNGKFIHYTLYDIIEHFKEVERGILHFYGLANNYNRIAARVHYILKYSCALTLTSKMRLGTLRKVFKKYGKNLSIKNEDNVEIINYPPIKYSRPRKFHLVKSCDLEKIVNSEKKS